MRCSGCGTENREGRRYCGGCGAPLARACAKCGFVNEPDEKFCGGCGRPLDGPQVGEAVAGSAPTSPPAATLEGERRQVTVLFCDLAGFTRLTQELGAEATHALTDRFFALADGVIERFGGSVDKHIGDCIMAVFGAPVAHDNDAERAVRAALEIRDAMPALSQELSTELDVHVGIASGQVVASSGAGHRQYSVTGESVNLASRLSDAAPAGTILVGDAVRRTLADRLDCTPIGALEVKGLSDPVQAFRLTGLHAQRVASGRPFVGRRAELHQLEGALEACVESGAGQAIYVRGEAGIGKTRLIEECQERAETLGFASHTGLVLDFGLAGGRDAIRELARSLLGVRITSSPAATEAAAEQAVRERWLAPERRVHLNDLLDLPQPVELRALYDAMDNATRSRGKQETLAELVVQASRQRPRLIIIEDLHWADPLTLEHLAHLTETVATCPVVLVMTSRLEGDPLDAAWRARVGGSPLLTIDLGPLRPDEADALAGAYLDATSDFARQCVERAAGNPLFLEQLLRHVEDSAAGGVPGTVQSLVQARLDHLPAVDRQALQAASVLGQRFSPGALCHLLERPDYDCGTLVRHFLLRPVGEAFLFAHALIRDGVYDSLLKARRLALHRRAAEWFAGRDPALRAEHLDRAEDPVAPRAYLDAARAEMSAYRNEQSLSLSERGLALAADQSDRFELLCLRGEILHHLGAMAEAGVTYAAALEAAPDDGARCRAWLGLAAVKRVTEDLDGAFADLERAEAAARRLNLNEQLARIHFLRGNLHFPRSEIEACLVEHQKSLEFAQAAGSAELEAAALGGLGDAEYVRGHMLSAGRYFERCIELCRRHGFGRIEVASLPMVAIARFYAGELDEAHADALAAVAAAQRVGHQRAEMIACHTVFITAMAQNDRDMARSHVDRGLVLSRQLGARRFEAEGLGFLAELLHAEGRAVEALAAIRLGVEISRETGTSYMGPTLLGALAYLATGPAERRAALAEGEQLLAGGSVSHNYYWFYQYAIETALESEEWSEAERYAAALEAYTRAEPTPWAAILVGRGRALAAIGRGQRDRNTIQKLEEVREQARTIGWLAALPALDTALAAAQLTSSRARR